jgi:hypothetical protein
MSVTASHRQAHPRNGTGDHQEWLSHTRVFLQPIAAPSILGLVGFAGDVHRRGQPCRLVRIDPVRPIPVPVRRRVRWCGAVRQGRERTGPAPDRRAMTRGRRQAGRAAPARGGQESRLTLVRSPADAPQLKLQHPRARDGVATLQESRQAAQAGAWPTPFMPLVDRAIRTRRALRRSEDLYEAGPPDRAA